MTMTKYRFFDKKTQESISKRNKESVLNYSYLRFHNKRDIFKSKMTFENKNEIRTILGSKSRKNKNIEFFRLYFCAKLHCFL